MAFFTRRNIIIIIVVVLIAIGAIMYIKWRKPVITNISSPQLIQKNNICNYILPVDNYSDIFLNIILFDISHWSITKA